MHDSKVFDKKLHQYWLIQAKRHIAIVRCLVAVLLRINIYLMPGETKETSTLYIWPLFERHIQPHGENLPPHFQVLPVFLSPNSAATAIANDFQKLAAEYNLPLTYSAMEGYINARVMVEAINRAGNKPTREGIVTALESMHKVDLGGYVLSFSATNHTGSEIVELTIIGKNGRFMR